MFVTLNFVFQLCPQEVLEAYIELLKKRIIHSSETGFIFKITQKLKLEFFNKFKYLFIARLKRLSVSKATKMVHANLIPSILQQPFANLREDTTATKNLAGRLLEPKNLKIYGVAGA